MNRPKRLRTAGTAAGSFLAAALLSPYQKHGLTDSSFLVGMLLLSAAGWLHVMRGGFFSNFSSAFRKLNRIARPEEQDNGEEPVDPDEVKERQRNLKEWAVTLAVIGLVLILLSWSLVLTS